MDIAEHEHASITTENRESLSTHMEKFDSFEAAALDGMDLKKQMGAPFKFPESMDKLPDNASRLDFKTRAHELLGIKTAKSVDDLKDIDFKVGLKEGAPVNEDFIGMVKKWAVEKGVDNATLSKLAEFYNGPLTEFSSKAFQDTEDAKFDSNAKTTNEGLIKHFGSQEKVDIESELFRRAVLNRPGMTLERAEKVADVFVDAMQKGGSDAAVTLLEMIAPMAKESSVDGGGGKPGGDPTAVDHPDLGSPSQFDTGLCTAAEHEAWKVRNPSG